MADDYVQITLQQRLSPSIEVCPDCGMGCQVLMQLADPAKATQKLNLNGGPPQSSMFVEEAYILCMWCLRRERRTYKKDSEDDNTSTVRHGMQLADPAKPETGG